MFVPQEAIKALNGRVGWRQQPAPFPFALSDANLASRSGRMFQDFHSIVTLYNVMNVMEDEHPEEDSFNGFLADMQNTAILGLLSGIFNEDTLVEHVITFDRNGERAADSRSVAGRKTGYRINTANDVSYCTVIKSVSAMFDADGTVTLVCEHSSKGKLWERDIEVKANTETVTAIDETLYFASDGYTGGCFYLYYETDGLVNPVEYVCTPLSKSRIFGLTAVETTGGWDDAACTDRSYGLAFEMCSYRDFTHVIKNSPQLFDTAIGLQVACSVIELIMSSTRSNFAERLTKELSARLYGDLNGIFTDDGKPVTTGIKNQIQREVSRLKRNLLPKPKPFTYTPCFTQRTVPQE